MITCSVEDLYDAIETPGGLSARVRLEVIAGDMVGVAGALDFEPADEQADTLPVPSERRTGR